MTRSKQTLEAVTAAQQTIATIIASVHGVLTAAELNRRDACVAAAFADGWSDFEVERAKAKAVAS